MGLRDVGAHLDARRDLFARNRWGLPALSSPEAREAIWTAWQRFLNDVFALDPVGLAHRRFAELKPPEREQAFATGHAAYVAQYRFALEFLARLEVRAVVRADLEFVTETGRHDQ